MEEDKRIGRPPKPDAVRKRKNQTFRIRDTTLARLSAAAADNQNSISEEIEQRLERSFEGPVEKFGQHNASLGQAVMQDAHRLEQMFGKSWPGNEVFGLYVFGRLKTLLSALMAVPENPMLLVPNDTESRNKLLEAAGMGRPFEHILNLLGAASLGNSFDTAASREDFDDLVRWRRDEDGLNRRTSKPE